MREVFKDIQLNNEIKEQGYVVVPFLNEEELKDLNNAFNLIPSEEINQFYATAHHPDIAFRKKMSEQIKKSLNRSLEEYTIDMDLLGGSFIAKPPEYNQVLQPHQDWNIVDETKYRSYNIWIPLVDTKKESGAIMVMPKSHQWISAYRHSSIPCAFSEVHHLLLQNMKTLDIKAGEALIYDHALIHASHENKSTKSRVACASGIKPKEAAMFFYWNNEGVIEKYESNVDFFMSQNVFEKPTSLNKINEVNYDFKTVNEQMFYSLSGIKPPEIKQEEKSEASEKREEKISFWKVYTPFNILREIKYRLTK